jgi:competence protein ComEC
LFIKQIHSSLFSRFIVYSPPFFCSIKRRIILAGALFAFLSGVFLGTLVSWQIALGIGLFGFFASGFWSAMQIRKKRILVAILIWALAFSLGVLRVEVVPREAPSESIGVYATQDGVPMEFLGVLSKFPDIREKEEKWTVQAQQIILGGKKKETSGKVLVQLPRDSDAEYGDTLRFTGTLEIPFESEEFSYKKYLSREGVFSIMSFPKFEKIGEKHHLLFSPLYQVRVWFDSELKKRIPSPESAFAAGILIGDRSGFSGEWEERFRITGLSHLLALSGYNVTIIALAVFFVTIWLPKNLRIATTVLFLATFVVFVGGGSSIIRAAIMGGIGLFIVHSGRTTHGLYLLLIACVIMAILHPLILVYDPSFQLSAAGVLGLLAFSEPIGRAAERFLQNRFFREILVATLAAQIGVLPLILYLFGEVSVISPIANVAVVPIIPTAMLFSFLAVMAGIFSPLLAGILAFVAWNILHAGMWIIEKLSQIPGASVSLQIGEVGLMGLFLGITICSFWVTRKKSAKK